MVVVNEKIEPIVTVIIPCHNKSLTIARAIASVMAQTINNLECFVINDRSSDNSEEIILETIGHDKRFSYHVVDYGNVATVRNYGISIASGLFYCCLDGDDWIDPLFLEECIPPLLEDRSLGITYTGLAYHKPDGSSGLSNWPGEYDYNKQLARQNQVPTCHVGRVDMWKRLGGQKQRYTGAGGAGAEDAEFVLRAGAYGYNARKVTTAGLFHYSWMTGLVSGNKEYREKDWLYWHPWTKDNEHPVASMATARRQSHACRQYDEPAISVIIPVGPGHAGYLEDALDSLEAQTFRKWEAVVVNDSGEALPERIMKAYPYMRLVETKGSMGAGKARNMGVKRSRAPMILFLDSDDFLNPEALSEMLYAWTKNEAMIYSDYYGVSVIDDPSKLAGGIKIVSRDANGLSVLSYRASDFDQNKAMLQPTDPPYLWCNVTTLMPRRWFDEVGGFDEAMPSYEDYDLFVRLAKAGKCFCRIPQPLMTYRFMSGSRRDTGYRMKEELFQYMKAKYRME